MGILDFLGGGTGDHPTPATPGSYTWDGKVQNEPLSGVGGGGVSPTLLALLSGAGQIGAKLAPQNPWAQTGTVAAQMAQPILADTARQVAQQDALKALPPSGTATVPTPQPSALGPVAPQQAATPAAPITAAPTTTSVPNTAPASGATPSSFTSAPTSSATSEAFSPQMHMWLGGLTPESYHAAMQEADAAIQRADRVHAQVLENQRLQQAQQMEQQRMVLAQNQDKREAAASDRAGLLAPLQLQNETAQVALNTKQAQNYRTPQQVINDKIKETQAVSGIENTTRLQADKDFFDYQVKNGAKGLDALHQTPEAIVREVNAGTGAVAVQMLKKAVPGNKSALDDVMSELRDPYTQEVSQQPDLHKILPQINDWLQSGQVPVETTGKNADGTTNATKAMLPMTSSQAAQLRATKSFITDRLSHISNYISDPKHYNAQLIANEQIPAVQDESSTPPPVLNPQTTATLTRDPALDNTPKGPSGKGPGNLLTATPGTSQLLKTITALPAPGKVDVYPDPITGQPVGIDSQGNVLSSAQVEALRAKNKAGK